MSNDFDFQFSDSFANKSSSEQGFWFQLRDEKGKKLFADGAEQLKPVRLKILGPDSAIAREYASKGQTEALRKATDLMVGRDTDEETEADREKIEIENISRTADLVVAWENVLDRSGHEVPLSRAAKIALFTKAPAARGQVLTEHQKRANFTTAPANGQ